MKHLNKIWMILTVCLLLGMLSCLTVVAEASTLGYETVLPATPTAIGDEVTLTVSLKNYTEQSDQIRGLQIDMTEIDTDILTVVSYESLISDPTADSNTASYSEANARLRLLYVNLQGTLPITHGESGLAPVFRVTFKINESVSASGQIDLPLTVKIQTTSGAITQNSTVTLAYQLHVPLPAVEENRVEATCTEAGSYDAVVYCANCDEELSRTSMSIPATGHTYTAATTAPTCTEQGYTTYTCHCGHSYQDEYVSAKGHTPASAVEENRVEPTCTGNGSYDSVVYCRACREVISRTTVSIPATDHTEGQWTQVTAPAVGVEGKEQLSCTVCDEILDERSIPALEPESESETQPETESGSGSETEAVSDTEPDQETTASEEVPTAPGEDSAEASADPATQPIGDDPVSAQGCDSSLASGMTLLCLIAAAFGALLMRRKERQNS